MCGLFSLITMPFRVSFLALTYSFLDHGRVADCSPECHCALRMLMLVLASIIGCYVVT